MSTIDVSHVKVLVVCGGWSDEHEISCQSGQECQKALIDAGFKTVDIVDIADAGAIEQMRNGGYDVVFIAMHGRYGEDGCIQGLCEILHIPYTFSGVLASSLATNKEVSKRIYEMANIRAPKGVVVPAGKSLNDAEIDSIVEDFGLPLFVKPSANGSSFGVSRVEKKEELNTAIAKAQGDDVNTGDVLVEECITGTEITVPVIGNTEDNPEALPIVEINTGADFYDIKVKYEPASMHHVIPANLDEVAYKKAQEMAVAAHIALGCDGCSRSDFIVTKEGEPVILETNTIPGMTERSLLPDSARHAGISFSELCTRFVEMALAKK